MEALVYLMEKDKVTERVTELFVATDQRDWPRVEACFTEKVYFDQTSLVGGAPSEVKPADITKGWDEGLKPLKAVHHQIGNLQIQLSDTQATVYCYGIAYHYLPNSSGKDTRTFVGGYEFGLAKEAEDWKINRFVYTVKFVSGNKELEKAAA
jgi:SnoaL-like protein